MHFLVCTHREDDGVGGRRDAPSSVASASAVARPACARFPQRLRARISSPSLHPFSHRWFAPGDVRKRLGATVHASTRSVTESWLLLLLQAASKLRVPAMGCVVASRSPVLRILLHGDMQCGWMGATSSLRHSPQGSSRGE